MQDWDLIGLLLLGVNVVLAGGVTVHAVLWKRDSRSVIGWVGLAWLAPILGSFAYLFLGVNRIESKARSLAIGKHRDALRGPRARDAVDRHQAAFDEKYASLNGLVTAGENISKVPLTAANSVELLVNGDEAYPEMLRSIRDARHSVSLLSYIFNNDRAGEPFFLELLKASERGVHVRVLVDSVGARYGRRPSMVRRLRSAGIVVATFLPTRIPRFPLTGNLRNHRKILVVDGRVGFTGGTNISEGHDLSLGPERPVQCLHFKLEGPVVSHLQKTFVADWACATGEMLSGPAWFPEVLGVGSVWARGVEDGPDEYFERIVDVIAAALASAQKRVRILTPYFLPHAPLISALNVAALRGVAVEIYIPSASNIALVHWAATAELWQLLEKGCRVFHTALPFDHTKLMIVDDVWAFLGSSNWDPRSLRLNFEFNVECYSDTLGATLNELVDKKAQNAQEVSLVELRRRAFPVRLRDGLARLLTPWL